MIFTIAEGDAGETRWGLIWLRQAAGDDKGQPALPRSVDDVRHEVYGSIIVREDRTDGTGTAADVGARRDPEFIRAHAPKLALLFERYHRTSVDGLEHVPAGPALAVGNHNGGLMAPDMFALMVAWWRRFGVDAPAYGLMHDLPFHLPIARDLMPRLGAVPAHPANALALLGRGAKVLVYPGGDIDAFRPWSQRHRIVFGQRCGFIRVALRARVPIVPIVSAGAHESFRILTDGRDLVRRLGLKRLFHRLEVFPITLCLPWGITFGPAYYLPVPVRMHLRALPPVSWPSLPPEAADDEATVWRCREQVRQTMQDALDEMTREGRYGRRRLFEPDVSRATAAPAPPPRRPSRGAPRSAGSVFPAPPG